MEYVEAVLGERQLSGAGRDYAPSITTGSPLIKMLVLWFVCRIRVCRFHIFIFFFLPLYDKLFAVYCLTGKCLLQAYGTTLPFMVGVAVYLHRK